MLQHLERYESNNGIMDRYPSHYAIISFGSYASIFLHECQSYMDVFDSLIFILLVPSGLFIER